MRLSSFGRNDGTGRRAGAAIAAALLVAALLSGALVSCTDESPPVRSASAGGEGSTPAPAPRSTDAGSTTPAAAERLDAKDAALPYPTFSWPPSAEALAAGFDSPTETAWMAIQAIDRNDREMMHQLLIDEATYMAKLWPSFEAEKPGSTIPAQFHWDHLEMKSLGGILDMTREYAGKGLRLRTVSYESVEDYVEFKLYRKPRVIVEDPLTGENEELRLFGDIVEIAGKHKLLSYPS